MTTGARARFNGRELSRYVRLLFPQPATWELQVTELDGGTAGLPAEIQKSSLTPFSQTVVLPWPNPRLWELGDPYLYRLEARLLDGEGKPLDVYPSVRFGFREVWAEGRELMLNGHPARLRLGYFTGSVPQMLFFEGMGFNAIEFQPNPTAWYAVWGMFPGEGLGGGSQALLDAADERGWAVLMPVPGVSYVRDALLKPEVEAAYRRDLGTWLHKLDRQNRPSILMWTPSMNTQGYPCASEMGRRPEVEQPAWFGKVDAILHEVDPGRLVFHHQGGRTGDVETSNLYLNFVPLAEQEEWLSDWSEHGDKPWGAVEHLSPVSLDFFKQGEAWYTEYAAIYLGDRAYALEQDEYLRACERAKAKSKGQWAGDLAEVFSRNGDIEHVGEWTGYYELCDRFFRGVNRAWRAYGGNVGWFPWLFDVGFGIPPGYQPTGNHWYMYETLQGTPEQLRQRPAWANPLYDAYRDTMQPLLVYLGGPLPRFTAIEPRYTAGETAERSIVAVWDGPGRRQFTARWTLEVGGKPVQTGGETYDLAPGAIEKRPLRFAVPAVTARTEAVLKLAVLDPAGAEIAHDETKLTIFPQTGPLAQQAARWGLYDPAGLAGDWLKLGLATRKVGLGENLDGLNVLMIGPRALSSGDLPFGEADVKRGLRVLILEQELAGLERFGFRCQDVMPRYAFPRVPGHPALAGLTAADFANWRGAGTLLPTTSAGMRPWPWAHGPHWGNTGSVASVIVETPSAVGFTPLLDCEFDLAYTPLLWLRHGQGEVLWSQLDLMGRLGAEPAADRVARNLVGYLDGPRPPAQDKAEVDGQELQSAADVGALRAGGAILTVGPEDDPPGGVLAALVRRGGTVFCLARNPAGLRALDLPWELPLAAKTAARVRPERIGDDPLVAGIGPGLVHWRRDERGDAFAEAGLPPGAVRLLDGWLLRVPQGQGQWVFCQLGLGDEPPTGGDAWRVGSNRMGLLCRLMTNLGDDPEPRSVLPLLARRPYARMVSVRLWQVREREDAPWRLRTTDELGRLELPEQGRAVTWVYSSTARQATCAAPMPGELDLKVNGQALPWPAGPPVMKLRAGWNQLEAAPAGPSRTLKVDLSDPGDLRVAPAPERPDWIPPATPAAALRPEPLMPFEMLYASNMPTAGDPYGFSAW